jgi:hypothetical protein
METALSLIITAQQRRRLGEADYSLTGAHRFLNLNASLVSISMLEGFLVAVRDTDSRLKLE